MKSSKNREHQVVKLVFSQPADVKENQIMSYIGIFFELRYLEGMSESDELSGFDNTRIIHDGLAPQLAVSQRFSNKFSPNLI